VQVEVEIAEDDAIVHIHDNNGHISKQGTHALLKNVGGWFYSLR
jgi:hypothetical protein